MLRTRGTRTEVWRGEIGGQRGAEGNNRDAVRNRSRNRDRLMKSEEGVRVDIRYLIDSSRELLGRARTEP